MRDWTGHLVVLGLGTSGEAAANWALDRAAAGAAVRVTVVDSGSTPALECRAAPLRDRGAAVLLGCDEIPAADLIVASPGIRPQTPLMRAALDSGTEVISEIELAYRISVAPWVAITGTNGKTTTTALVTHLLCEAGFAAEAAGNIGSAAVTTAAQMGPAGVIVAEVSSFQLTLTKQFHPRVAALLNITPDHIDYHGSMEAYAAEKAKVFANMVAGDTAVIDVDDPGSARYVDEVEARGITVCRVSLGNESAGGAFVLDGMLSLEDSGSTKGLVTVAELGIKGEHNVSNALAAAACARAFGADLASIRSGLMSFTPIEHRLEPAGCVCGVEYFNDSKATNPDAVMKALTAFGDRPLVLLLGGRNKGVDMHPLARAVAARARVAVLFGEAAQELAEAFDGLPIEIVPARGVADALAEAQARARRGEVVLLSPGCTSFDEFSGYEERGRYFKHLVTEADSGEEAGDAPA